MPNCRVCKHPYAGNFVWIHTDVPGIRLESGNFALRSVAPNRGIDRQVIGLDFSLTTWSYYGDHLLQIILKSANGQIYAYTQWPSDLTSLPLEYTVHRYRQGCQFTPFQGQAINGDICERVVSLWELSTGSFIVKILNQFTGNVSLDVVNIWPRFHAISLSGFRI